MGQEHHRRYSAFRRALSNPVRWLLAPLLQYIKLQREQQLEALKCQLECQVESELENLKGMVVWVNTEQNNIRGMNQRSVAELFFARFRDTWNRTGERSEYFSRFLLLQCDNLELVPHLGINLGDYVQAAAVERLMQGIAPDIPRNFIERGFLSFYQGEKAFVVMQGWFSHDIHFFPNDHIWPVYVGFHVTKETEKVIMTFLRFNPHYFDGHQIGCRDRSTLDFCRNINLDAYFSRCATLTLPRRKVSPVRKKVFFVDVPDYIQELIPAHIREGAEHVNQRISQEYGDNLSCYYNSAQHYSKKTEELLERYRDEATLVVTIAVHCASPCTAMGIPVVLFNVYGEEATRRFDFLSDIIPVYTLDELREGRVNWEPEVPDIEPLKEDMELNLRLTIEHERTGVKPKELDEVRARLLTPIR